MVHIVKEPGLEVTFRGFWSIWVLLRKEKIAKRKMVYMNGIKLIIKAAVVTIVRLLDLVNFGYKNPVYNKRFKRAGCKKTYVL